ncbi:MAG: DUF4080 domain-containing protein [Bacteroidales bacterium]|nr:DUF4080 domain-containing protein [Bacteroidales bacterium]
MKVLLTTINSKYIHQNLAIGLLYELNKDYVGLSVKEFTSKTPLAEIAGYCSSFEIVAFSCYIWNIEQTLEVARQIKQLSPECKVLLGGPEVSYEWDDIIALPEVDFIIIDEGEVPFAAFLKHYPNLSLVPGLVWQRNGEVVCSDAPEVFSLDNLKEINPYLSIPAEELRNKVCYVEASRGCPNRCAFCLAGLQNTLRYLPMEYIHSSLLYLMENGRVVKFLDRTFNANQSFAISIFQFIIQHHRPGNIFQFEIKADILQTELIEFVRTQIPKGIFRFEIGIQTLNAKSNSEVKRRLNFENIKTFVEQVSERVEIHLDLIVGLPYDYYDDIKYSFEEVFKLFAPELQLGFLKFLKGTPIRRDYKQHGYRFQQQPPYQIMESNYLSKQELGRIEHVEHALDTYWNKKRALHTLRYVALNHSIYDFLKGLGTYWNQHNERRNIGLIGVYTTIYDYAVQQYPTDTLLVELIALDYYLQHKIRPATRFLPEVKKEQRLEAFSTLNLNHHKYRYAMHKVQFDVQHLLSKNTIKPKSDLLVIEFSGVEFPKVVG